MRTVELKRDLIYTGNLILVNRQYPYRENLSERILKPVGSKFDDVLLENKTAVIYQNLMDELGAWERITAVSGWRSKDEQERIYKECLNDYGVEFTGKYVAFPGHSEHQTGMAVDLGLCRPDIDFLRPHFPYDGICGTFREKALHYGFIERYPRDKENITGIAHEPWHFRYVGAPHAYIMNELNLSLEEYHELLLKYSYTEPLSYVYCRNKLKIFYLAAEAETTGLHTIDDIPFMVSGNNMDGFIITVWDNCG